MVEGMETEEGEIMLKLVMTEYQKTRVCKYYECSDGQDRQYLDCKNVRWCPLHTRIYPLLDYLNKEESQNETDE